MAAKFPPPYQFHWRAGPYLPHGQRRGSAARRVAGRREGGGHDRGTDSLAGGRLQEGPGRTLLPILCGDLVRAVCEEDELTVAYYWGVTRYMVEQWKRAISGAKDSNGVFAGLAFKRNDPEFRKRFGYQF